MGQEDGDGWILSDNIGAIVMAKSYAIKLGNVEFTAKYPD